MELRCLKEYMIRNTEMVRCARTNGHDGECQLNMWWALKVPDLEVSIRIRIEVPDIAVRRVK
jgi:hypothetical protein